MLKELLKKVEKNEISKSEMFRRLYEKEEMSISSISKKTNNNYSFVYGVIRKYCDKNDIKLRKSKSNKNTKSEKFRNDFLKGMSIGEISKKYNSNYSYVWTVCDKYRKGDKYEEDLKKLNNKKK